MHFSGLPPGYKGYKLYDLAKKTIFHSRDVVFHENVFPFKLASTPVASSPSSLLFPSPTISQFLDSLSAPSSPPTPLSPSRTFSPPSITSFPLTLPLVDSAVSPSSISPSVASDSVAPAATETVVPSSPRPVLRRSTRSRCPPAWLHDYHRPQPQQQPSSSSSSHSFTSITPYPLFSYAHLAHLSPNYMASLYKVLHDPVPHSYFQAQHCPEWVLAMNQELQALEDNHTWLLTSLPPGKKALSSKWFYRTKYRADGSVERYKARLVIRGFEQIKDKDYKHTFSPVAKLTSVRVFIALATAQQWPLHQLDINNAFLHGFIDEEVFMVSPQGYTKALPGQVCKLQRSLYGLKQASRQWNLELTRFLVSKGFLQSKSDYSLFSKVVDGKYTFLLVYVDDLLLTGNDHQGILTIKQALHSAFTIKDLGLARYFLGIEIARSPQGTFINQRKYILDILHDAGLTGAKPALFPLPKHLNLSLDTGDPLSDPSRYRQLVGRLLYLTLTRPDLSYSVQHLSQFLLRPCTPHYQAALHILRYLKGTANKGLFYPTATSLQLQAYTCSYRLIPMQIGVLAGFLHALLLATVFFLVHPSFLGKQRSRRQWPSLLQRLSTEACLPLLLNSNGFILFSTIFTYGFPYLLPCFVTTRLLNILLKISCSMNAPNIFGLTVIILATKCWKASCTQHIFLLLSSLPI